MSMTDQEKIVVLQAKLAGEDIQYRCFGKYEWRDRTIREDLNFSLADFRIKPEQEYVELNVIDAFELLARGVKVMCQFKDCGASWGYDAELTGAAKKAPRFISETGYGWDQCRVTKEVYDAR